MLQINTGKLFARGVGRTNNLVGVLYSNARLPFDRALVTAAGTLKSTGSGPADLALVYELEERIEAQEDGPGVLVSHTVSPFLDDFAAVASFGLGAMFSRDADTVRYLTGGRPGFASFDPPGSFIARVFNQSRYLTEETVAAFEVFVAKLLALDRRTFLAAMRAMRTLVAGLQRMPDDLPLAYTMMVSATESLAQDFDGFEPVWADLDDAKRRAVDRALAHSAPEVAGAVRGALLRHEHVAIARRYRAFMLSHVDDAYFRDAAVDGSRPVARYELEQAVRAAYNLRSAYVHRLSALPTSISHPHAHWECTTVDRKPALTFQGLYRLTRHAIRRFVETGQSVDREEYDYTLEQSGVISVEFGAQYWVWRPFEDASEAGRRLEGMLSILHSLLLGEKVELADMRPVLAEVERLLPQAPRDSRPALLLFHILTNWLSAPENRSPGAEEFLVKHEPEAFSPGPEALIVGTYTGRIDHWSQLEHGARIDQYFAQRVRKGGLHAPRVLEVATILALAERYRLGGDHETARLLLARAVESDPSDNRLREFEASWAEGAAIDWRSILISKNAEHGEADGSPLA